MSVWPRPAPSYRPFGGPFVGPTLTIAGSWPKLGRSFDPGLQVGTIPQILLSANDRVESERPERELNKGAQASI